MLSRLEITRETMTEILSGDGSVAQPEHEEDLQAGGVAEAAGLPVEEGKSRFGVGSPVGVRLMPQWSPGLAVGCCRVRIRTPSRSSTTPCVR